MGLRGASGSVVAPLAGLDQAHLWCVNFYDRPDLAHDGILQSEGDFIWVLALLPLVLGPDLLGCGPLSPLAHVRYLYCCISCIL
jgi:hypothetical protein